MLLMKETKSSESGNIKKLNAVKKKEEQKNYCEKIFDTFEEEYSNHSPKPHSC